MSDDAGDQIAPPPPVEAPIEVPAAEAAPPPPSENVDPSAAIPTDPAEQNPEPVESKVPEVEETKAPASSNPAPAATVAEQKQQTPQVTGLPARGLAARRARKDAKLQKILALAKEKEFITNDDVEKLLHVSNKTATRYLNAVVKEGKLQRMGSESHPHYSLVK